MMAPTSTRSRSDSGSTFTWLYKYSRRLTSAATISIIAASLSPPPLLLIELRAGACCQLSRSQAVSAAISLADGGSTGTVSAGGDSAPAPTTSLPVPALSPRAALHKRGIAAAFAGLSDLRQQLPRPASATGVLPNV